MAKQSVSQLFNIQYPIIQAGMVWCSGWRLASAVSNSGGLGLIGAGSMKPDVLREHLLKCKAATHRPFGVNLPLLYSGVEEQLKVILEEGVKIVFTSAGNPALFTDRLKKHGITVVHVVSSSKFAKKAEEAGCDAVVAEGFEAGGHNGRDETTTFCLVPLVCKAVAIPVIAAGGIFDGNTMLAAMALGASGVQVGSRFAITEESSAHPNFKQQVMEAKEGSTDLTLKELAPVRLLKNEFWKQVEQAYARSAGKDELLALLGKGRARRGIFDGDVVEGELEIGQVAASINQLCSAQEVVRSMVEEYNQAVEQIQKI